MKFSSLETIVKGFLILAGLMTALVGAATPGRAQSAAGSFGAIAFSTATGAIGFGQDNATREEAESVALQNCRAVSTQPDDCKTVMWFQNACAAIAVGDDGGYGWAWHANRDIAAQNSIAQCQRYSKGGCRVMRRACSSAR